MPQIAPGRSKFFALIKYPRARDNPTRTFVLKSFTIKQLKHQLFNIIIHCSHVSVPRNLVTIPYTITFILCWIDDKIPMGTRGFPRSHGYQRFSTLLSIRAYIFCKRGTTSGTKGSDRTNLNDTIV